MYYLYEGLGPKSLKTVKLWENAGQKILEAELTADQIKQLFQQVEQGVTAGGGNRTTIGKGKDVATAVNKAWEDLKTKVQDSGPIKGVDAMYDKAADKLKQATGGDEGVMKYVQKYRDFAKKHPIAQSLIYSALIAAAGISGAGVGGAAALGLFKLVDKLLQGEKFSSAAYAGAKTGGMAYAAGQIGQAIKGQPQQAPYGSQPGENEFVGMTDVPGTSQAGSIISSGGQAISNSPISYEQALEQAKRTGATGLQAKNLARSIMKGATAAATQTESVKLSENQIYYAIGAIVNRQQKLSEGVVDAVKGAAGKAADWAKTKGHNVTTKITADKLLQAWNKAGKPTDSEKVSQVLTSAGVPQDTVSSVFTAMKIPTQSQATDTKTNDATTAPQTPQADTPIQPNTPTDTTQGNKMNSTTEPANTTYSQVKTLIDKMDKGGKKRMADALKKSLGMISESKEQIQQNLQQLQQQQYNLEAVINQVRQTTKAIKHDDTIHGIMNGIKQLAQKAGIDASELRYAENQVLDAFNELESAVYGLEEAFTDKLRDVQNQVEDLEYELENPDELDEAAKNSHGHTKKQQAAIAMAKQGVAEGNGHEQYRVEMIDRNGKLQGVYHKDNTHYNLENMLSDIKGYQRNNPRHTFKFYINGKPVDWKELLANQNVAEDAHVDSNRPAKVLAKNLKKLTNVDYDTVDRLMKAISKKYNLSNDGKDLHVMFAKLYGHNPDYWVRKQKGLAEGALNEFAPDDGGGDEEDMLLKFARMWYNGDLPTQQQIEKILARSGWEIGELESEEGGAFVVQAGDENGNSYIGFSVADLTEGLAEADSKHPGLWANIHAKRERIKHGSHEHMRKPGSKGAPTAQAFKDSAKTSKNESSIMSGVKNVSR